MRKIVYLFTTFLLAFTFLSNAQSYRPKASSISTDWYISPWTIEGNIGTRALGVVSEGVDNGLGLALNGGFGYSFSKAFGLKGRMDYYNNPLTPGFNGAENSTTGSLGLSLIANINLIALANKGKRSDWVLNLYAGSGLTSSWNADFKEFYRNNIGDFNDPIIKGNEDMGHVVVGLNPQFYVTSRFALSLDISYFSLFNQDNTYDYAERLEDGQLGNALTIGLGFVWRPYGTKK
jgi:hypothetical protein